MSGTRCAILGCNNNYQVNKTAKTKIIMHIFPRGKNCLAQSIRREWVRLCGRTDGLNPDTSRICSEHFVKGDYERDLKNELLGLPLKRILKKSAVPTLRLPDKVADKSESVCDCDDNCPTRKSEAALIFDEQEGLLSLSAEDFSLQDILISQYEENGILEYTEEGLMQDRTPFFEADLNLTIPDTSRITQHAEDCRQHQNHELEYARLLREHNNLRLKYSQVKLKTSKKIKALNDQLRYFKTKYYNGPKVEKAELHARNLLKELLTENQIALLSDKKKRVNWNKDEISMALTLRHYNKECYIYLRDKLQYPLPSLSTLRNMTFKTDDS